MYYVIYWLGDDEVYPCLDDSTTLKLFDTLEEAKKYAKAFEEIPTQNEEIKARVVSLETN